jgi:hypothetical protein
MNVIHPLIAPIKNCLISSQGHHNLNRSDLHDCHAPSYPKENTSERDQLLPSITTTLRNLHIRKE